MKKNCLVDDGDEVDLKGGIQGGAHRTAACLGERRRHDRPSGLLDTPKRRAPTNVLVEQEVECGLALQASATLKIVPVANPTTGNSSTQLSDRCGRTHALTGAQSQRRVMASGISRWRSPGRTVSGSDVARYRWGLRSHLLVEEVASIERRLKRWSATIKDADVILLGTMRWSLRK